MVDTNSNPNDVIYPIPANDDAATSIDIILSAVCNAIAEGLAERSIENISNEKAEKFDDETSTISKKYETVIEGEEETETTKKPRGKKRIVKK
jgi:small subunit ribosomal protein S2